MNTSAETQTGRGLRDCSVRRRNCSNDSFKADIQFNTVDLRFWPNFRLTVEVGFWGGWRVKSLPLAYGPRSGMATVNREKRPKLQSGWGLGESQLNPTHFSHSRAFKLAYHIH